MLRNTAPSLYRHSEELFYFCLYLIFRYTHSAMMLVFERFRRDRPEL